MKCFLLILFVVVSFSIFSNNPKEKMFYIDESSQVISYEEIVISYKKPNPLIQLFHKKHKLNKKITAAVLAFPFPFGIVGLHRIYLGTHPHVPVVYIASIGGVFGILPLIDFIAITTSKDFEHFKNNGKVFMWIK